MFVGDGAWHCPACSRELYAPGRKGIPHHPCPKLGGLMAPMVPAGQRAGLKVIVREDYSHGQILQVDDEGKAAMAIVVTRDDGEDCSVLAPVATARGANQNA
jgi:hypothetical protein